ADGAGAIAQSLPAPEEEGLVSLDPAPSDGAKLVAAEGRLSSARAAKDVVEIVLGVQRTVAQEVVSGAVKAVGARVSRGGHLRRTTAEFGRVGVLLHLKLLDFIDGGCGSESVEVGLRVGGAVQEEVGVLSPCSSQRVLVARPAPYFAHLLEGTVV